MILADSDTREEITKDLATVFKLTDAKAAKITLITGRARLFKRVFELMAAKWAPGPPMNRPSAIRGLSRAGVSGENRPRRCFAPPESMSPLPGSVDRRGASVLGG